MSVTASERPNTHARISLYVGDERNSSWSFFERIRLDGIWKVSEFVSGGGGSSGVSGRGVGFVRSLGRLRGSSLGSRSFKDDVEGAPCVGLFGFTSVSGMLLLASLCGDKIRGGVMVR